MFLYTKPHSNYIFRLELMSSEGCWLDHDNIMECSKQWPSPWDCCVRRSFTDSSNSKITALEQKLWHTQQDICCNQIIVNNEKCLKCSRTAS